MVFMKEMVSGGELVSLKTRSCCKGTNCVSFLKFAILPGLSTFSYSGMPDYLSTRKNTVDHVYEEYRNT